MLNALLAWPDHPYGFGTLYGSEFDPETKCRESFVIAETVDLDKNETYAKERALIEEVKAQLARGRKCQVFAVYRRLERSRSLCGLEIDRVSGQHHAVEVSTAEKFA
jgi:hypothetical protein